MASLGDLIIKVGGDPSGFKAAMADASDTADRFTSKITDSVAQGVTLFDAYGNVIQETTGKAAAGIIDLGAAETQAAAAAEEMAAAHSHAVSEIQATSGALRVLEGSGGLRAAERFLATTLGLGPALQSIFPIIGAIAFAELLAKVADGVKKVADEFDPVAQATARAEQAAKDYDEIIKKLGNDIRALDKEAFENAQGKANARAKESADLEQQVQTDRTMVALLRQQVTEYANIAAAKKKAAGEAPSALDEGGGSVLVAAREATAAAKDLETAQKRLAAFEDQLVKDTQEASKATRESLEEGVKDREKYATDSAAAAREAATALKQNDETTLAEMKSHHALSVGEIIQYWQKRLAAESGNAQRAREIQIQLGNLYQQSFAELERAREKDLKDEQHYQDSLASTRAHFAKEAAEQAKKRNEEAKSEVKITVPLQSRIAGPLADVIALNQAGLRTVEIQESQILHEQVLLDLARQFDVPLGDQYAFKEKILADEIALGEKTGQNISAQLIGLAAVKDAQARLRQQADGIATVYLKIKSEFDGLVGNLGSAISSGIFSGRGIAAAITDSLKHAGQQILGGVFQQAINRLVAELGINRAVTAALNAIMGVHTGATTANTATLGAHIGAITAHAGVMLSHLGVMVTHIGVMIGTTAATIANTAATIVNTFWLAIKSAFSFLGFADGGNPPIGVPSIVGERGPEIIVPRGPVSVLPNSAFRAALGSNSGVGRGTINNTGGNNITINVNGAVSPKETVRQIARYMKTAGGPQFSPASS